MQRVGLREWLALGRVIASNRLTRYGAGERGQVARFERRMAEKVDADHVLTTTSGTTALISALAAAGIGPGDEVLVPAYTWISTAAAPLAVGAIPVLVEIDESLTIDPADIEDKITPRTKAIIPVHMNNLVCDMDRIMESAARHDLLVIEDACQAVGVTYRGRHTGTIGHAGAFSFNSYKNMNAGEGGAVLTSDARLYERARMFHDVGSFARGHGESDEPIFVGSNFKANELMGAVLNVQLSRLGPYLQRLRRRRAILADAVMKRGDGRIAPHHDPAHARGLAVTFPSAAAARQFAENRGVTRVLDSSRHVYTNWEAILSQASFHPSMNPWRWSMRETGIDVGSCPRTLDILSRSCVVSLGARYPLPVIAWFARKLAAPQAGSVPDTPGNTIAEA
jgi:dTDP-4-amino-4,6-dideoxygalactose transaminase